MQKIYSIVVTYQTKENDLSNLINILKKQTNMVIICNNSNFNLSFNDDKILVFNFGKNLGIAEAQSIGMKYAFENGADFIIQFDQDSIPSDDLVFKLKECYDNLILKGYKIGIVGPKYYDKDSGKEIKAKINKGIIINNTNYVLLSEIISSGSLIPKNVYYIVGGMDNELFIDAVDSEYCWRIRKNGFLVVRNNEALLFHKLGNGNKKLFGFINVGVPNPIRHYYQFRNTFLLIRRPYVPLYWKLSMIAKVVFKLFVYPLTFNNGFKRLQYMIKGIGDGIIGKKGEIQF